MISTSTYTVSHSSRFKSLQNSKQKHFQGKEWRVSDRLVERERERVWRLKNCSVPLSSVFRGNLCLKSCQKSYFSFNPFVNQLESTFNFNGFKDTHSFWYLKNPNFFLISNLSYSSKHRRFLVVFEWSWSINRCFRCAIGKFIFLNLDFHLNADFFHFFFMECIMLLVYEVFDFCFFSWANYIRFNCWLGLSKKRGCFLTSNT